MGSIPVRVTINITLKWHKIAVWEFFFLCKNSPWVLYGSYGNVGYPLVNALGFTKTLQCAVIIVNVKINLPFTIIDLF